MKIKTWAMAIMVIATIFVFTACNRKAAPSRESEQFDINSLQSRLVYLNFDQIDEEEIYYLTSRGLTEEEATSMIVRGFLSMDIAGLPPELASETKKMIDMSLEGI